jgi:hypothetical protein
MGIRDRLRRLEHSTEGETVLAACLECGEEKRIRDGIFLDLVALEWKMHQSTDTDEEELLANEPEDERWVWEQPCDALALRDKQTGQSIFGALRAPHAGSWRALS